MTLGTFVEGRGFSPYATSDNIPSPVKLIDIAIKSGTALENAHGDDVVQRDIKPANIAYAPAADMTFFKLTSARVTYSAPMVNDLRACVSSLAS